MVEGERLTTTAPPQPGADLLDTPEAGAAAIRGGALRLAGYGGGVVFALASVPLLVRHLGVVDFGRYTLVLSIIAMVQGLTEGGLQAIGVREYSVLGQAERDLMMRRLLALRVLATGGGVGLALAFCAIAGYGSTIVLGTLVAGIGLLLLVLFNLLSVPLAANLRFGWITAADLARQGLATVLIIALVVAGAGLVPLLAVQIPACLLACGVTLVLVRRMTTLTPAFDPPAWWSLLRDTLPYAIAIAVAALYFRVTIVIMSLVASDDATGYFATSYRIIEVLVGIPLLLVASAFPILSRAARDDSARLRYASQRTLDLMLVLGAWVSLVVGVAAPLHHHPDRRSRLRPGRRDAPDPGGHGRLHVHLGHVHLHPAVAAPPQGHPSRQHRAARFRRDCHVPVGAGPRRQRRRGRDRVRGGGARRDAARAHGRECGRSRPDFAARLCSRWRSPPGSRRWSRSSCFRGCTRSRSPPSRR